ncbi:hypothetical protein ACEZCY_04905 [Streptacidiphilus sp. N1-12]|uniref:Uncharacterized protein n=2 Tax=Streptacidiphilus alkalitolerans TaxID=3342712 RepID=A0ABV6V4I4_9ACTN
MSAGLTTLSTPLLIRDGYAEEATMTGIPVGESELTPVMPGEGTVPEWVIEAREDPNGLAALIAGQYLDLYRRLEKMHEQLAYLRSADAAVRADMARRVLGSSSAAALRAAQVPLEGINTAIQQGIRAGRWSVSRLDRTESRSPEIDRAFSEAAAGWQRALEAAISTFEESVRGAQAAFDGYEPYADRLRPGDDSYLAPFAFPQDSYIGDNLAADPAFADMGRTPSRWLMRLNVLPHRPWASLPKIDVCNTNLVFVPDGSNLSYTKATAAAQAIVADQMSRTAPNRLRITWIDALHNGRSAGAFLRLAESDSHIIDGQVWSDPGRIEAALLRVVDRIAAIERTCLKNEFNNLSAYNAQHGVAPEAHQVVVVAGYPVGFRESSAQLLRQISNSSTRAGISLIIIMDTSMSPILGMAEEVAPSYARLIDGPGPVNGPAWWSLAVLPVGEFIVGHAGQSYARVVTIPQDESTWVPCELQTIDEAIQASIINDYARASLLLAQSGLSPRELDVKRNDPTARTVSLRSAMISWLREQEAANQNPPGWDGFVGSGAVQRTGITYTSAEIAKQASYLCDVGYIVAGAGSPDAIGTSFPRLTSKGEDMAMSGSSSAEDFAVNSARSGAGTTNNYSAPVFHGNMNGAQIAWGNHDVSQSQTRLEQVAPGFEALAEAVTRTLAQLPQFGLPAEECEDVSASANEILVEVVSSSPDRGKIRRALAALRGLLQPVAVQAALGAGDGSHDLAKAALDHLQSVIF